MLQMNVYHFSIKALEERPAQEEAKKEENVNLAHVVQNKKNATLIFQKLKLDSQWLTCSAISNFNQIDNHKILCLKQGIFFCLFLILI